MCLAPSTARTPKNLKNTESSLIFIPETSDIPLPQPEETNQKLLSGEKNRYVHSLPTSD